MVLCSVKRRTRLGQLAVEQEPAVVDDDHPPAERFHVGHVVAGEEDGRAGAAVVLRDEGPDAPLHRHVQPDGRLVEEDHLRAMEERRGDLAFHPLAQREVAHRLAQERPEFQKLGKLVEQALGNRPRGCGRWPG